MKFNSEIQVFEDIENIERLFVSEQKEFANKRAKYELVKSKGKLTFKVETTDATALRAVLNSIAKTLSTYEKTKHVIKGEDNDEQ